LQAKAAISAPTDDSHAATLAGTEASDKDDGVGAAFDARFADNFDGLDWLRLPQFIKPLSTQLYKKS
jgi:hypothetical protein